MKKRKDNKIALIHFLSNPKIKISYWRLEKDTVLTTTGPTGYVTQETTGNGTIEIQYFEKSNK